MADTVIAGRYLLRQRIGAGGMSEVWAAEDLELDRAVAVKLLGPDADPARFDQEAQAVAALSHANICALYDYGRADGRRFMVLEYLSGGSLDDRLVPGQPLADESAYAIAAEIAAGLAHAHARGVVHRDLKPANILFDAEGRAKIADFGIARVGGETGLTEVGTVLGTAAYLSPEQAAGEPATPASDVYAFGVILYRMLTGRLPFESSDAIALAAMHRELPAPPVTSLRPDAPVLLESVAAAALAKSPSDRPRDGVALAAELRRPTDTLVEETAATQVIPPPPRRNRLLLALTAAAVAAAGIGVAMAVTIGGGPAITTSSSTPPSTTRPTTTVPIVQPGTGVTPPTTESTTVESETTTGTVPSTTATTLPVTTSAPTTTSRPVTTASTTTAPATTTSLTTTAPATSETTTTEAAPTTTAPTTTTATVPG